MYLQNKISTKDDIVLPQFVSFTRTWHNAPYERISPRRTELSAARKFVVVTGGGTGIGKAIAKAFAQAGASSVAILGRREDRLKTAVGEIARSLDVQTTKLQYAVADLTKREDVARALQGFVERQGGKKIDIFVSNAGALPTPGYALQMDQEVFMKGFDSNVRSALNAVHSFLAHAAKDATLLNISTGIVHMLPLPGMSAYAASKAANAKLIDYIQAENPELHAVNVQPGVVATEINSDTNMQGQDDGE